jgi:hypothetical protein
MQVCAASGAARQRCGLTPAGFRGGRPGSFGNYEIDAQTYACARDASRVRARGYPSSVVQRGAWTSSNVIIVESLVTIKPEGTNMAFIMVVRGR